MYFMCVPPSVNRMTWPRIDSGRGGHGGLLRSGVSASAADDVAALYRSDWGRIVAALIRILGDFDLAEETAQEAFTAAVDQWRSSGVPEFPRAWIIQTARKLGN